MTSLRSPPAAPPVPQNPEFVPPDLVCSLCHELSTEPTLTPCEHLFCRKCIHESLQHRYECPIDRRPLEEEDLNEASGILRRIYEGVAVRCPNKGCDWTGVVGNYSAHSQRCVSAAPVDSSIEYLRQEIQSKEMIIQEKEKLLLENLREKKALACMVAALSEKVETLKLANIKVDDDYNYDRWRVKELSLLICRYLEDKPDEIDRNRIYNCVKKCYDDYCSEWDDNPEYYDVDVRMLIHICLASSWFSDKQYGNIQGWA